MSALSNKIQQIAENHIPSYGNMTDATRKNQIWLSNILTEILKDRQLLELAMKELGLTETIKTSDPKDYALQAAEKDRYIPKNKRNS